RLDSSRRAGRRAAARVPDRRRCGIYRVARGAGRAAARAAGCHRRGRRAGCRGGVVSARGPVPPPTGGTPKTQEQARAMVRAFLTEEQERLWYGLMETYDALLGALDARMLAGHNMPLSSFEAL